MGNKRPIAKEIFNKLRQVEVLVGNGTPRLDAIREVGVMAGLNKGTIYWSISFNDLELETDARALADCIGHFLMMVNKETSKFSS